MGRAKRKTCLRYKIGEEIKMKRMSFLVTKVDKTINGIDHNEPLPKVSAYRGLAR